MNELGHESLGTVQFLLELAEAEVWGTPGGAHKCDACVVSNPPSCRVCRPGGKREERLGRDVLALREALKACRPSLFLKPVWPRGRREHSRRRSGRPPCSLGIYWTLPRLVLLLSCSVEIEGEEQGSQGVTVVQSPYARDFLPTEQDKAVVRVAHRSQYLDQRHATRRTSRKKQDVTGGGIVSSPWTH